MSEETATDWPEAPGLYLVTGDRMERHSNPYVAPKRASRVLVLRAQFHRNGSEFPIHTDIEWLWNELGFRLEFLALAQFK